MAGCKLIVRAFDFTQGSAKKRKQSVRKIGGGVNKTPMGTTKGLDG